MHQVVVVMAVIPVGVVVTGGGSSLLQCTQLIGIANQPVPVIVVGSLIQHTPAPGNDQPKSGSQPASLHSATSSMTTALTSNLDNRAALEAERKKQKEKFLIFTRVLMKDL
jgi:hypothetical protein